MKSFNEHTLICEVNPDNTDTFIPSLNSIDFDITGTYSEIDSTQSLIQTSKKMMLIDRSAEKEIEEKLFRLMNCCLHYLQRKSQRF